MSTMVCTNCSESYPYDGAQGLNVVYVVEELEVDTRDHDRKMRDWTIVSNFMNPDSLLPRLIRKAAAKAEAAAERGESRPVVTFEGLFPVCPHCKYQSKEPTLQVNPRAWDGIKFKVAVGPTSEFQDSVKRLRERELATALENGAVTFPDYGNFLNEVDSAREQSRPRSFHMHSQTFEALVAGLTHCGLPIIRDAETLRCQKCSVIWSIDLLDAYTELVIDDPNAPTTPEQP